MSLRRTVSALLFVVALGPGSARAQNPADRATARALAAEGQEALDKKDFVTAADRFSRADSLYHAPTLVLGLAEAQVGQGKLIDALETYNRLVREGVPPKSPPAFTKALADAVKELDALTRRIPTVTINVTGSKDASVTLDGAPVPGAALGVKRLVDPGKHIIRATASGFEPSESTVNIPEGKGVVANLELKVISATHPVLVSPPVVPPARVDPSPSAPKPRPVAKPPAAKPIPPPVIATVPQVANPDGGGMRPQKILGIAALGLGGAGLVLGGITGVIAIGKSKSLKEGCSAAPCRVDPSDGAAADSYRLMANLSTVGVVIGSAAAVTGVVLLVLAPKSKSHQAVVITPLVGAGFVGATGSF
ncbi:MAG: hypothetical protein ABI193_17655 [Minicystis sp.]